MTIKMLIILSAVHMTHATAGTTMREPQPIQKQISEIPNLTILDDSYLVLKKNGLTDFAAEFINEYPLISIAAGTTLGYFAWKGLRNASASINKYKNHETDTKKTYNAPDKQKLQELQEKNQQLEQQAHELVQFHPKIWNFFIQQHPQPLPQGLENNGNTCYRNATLQALHHLYPEIYRCCLVAEKKDYSLRENKIFQDFKRFVRLRATGNESQPEIFDLMSPQFSAFEQLCAGHFKKFRKQEDAAEFFTKLQTYDVLDRQNKTIFDFTFYPLEEHYIKQFAQPTVVAAQGIIGNFLSLPFCTIEQDKIITLQSDTTQPHKSMGDPIKYLLPIPLPQEDTEETIPKLEELLKQLYSSQEEINNYKLPLKDYEVGNPGETAYLQNQITNINGGTTLCIQLKRFYKDKNDFFEKNNNLVTIPLTLQTPKDIFSETSPLKNNPPKFKLKSFVSHIGDSIYGGHYIAYVNHNNQWYCCDDKTVSEKTDLPTDENAVLDQEALKTIRGTPYLLFYERIDTKPVS